MQITSKVVALCVLQAIGASAFFVQSNVQSRVALQATNPEVTSGSSNSRGKSAYREGLRTQNYVEARRKTGVYEDSRRSQFGEKERPLQANAEIVVQGESLRTWSITSPFVESVKVNLFTQGRPLNANVDLWQGPDNTPQRMSVYLEDGNTHPFSAIIQTPRGSNAVAIRNTGQLEFPMSARIETESRDDSELIRRAEADRPRVIQGGALKTYPFEPRVASVLLLLKTDGRPLNARIELLQGPNNDKQVVEVYTEDGFDRPFFAILETPGSGNVLRIVNTATMEYPMTCSVVPYEVLDPSRADGGFPEDDGVFMIS